MKFALVKPIHPGHVHHHAFDEVITSVRWGLNALGHEVWAFPHFHEVPADYTPIAFGMHMHNADLHGHFPDNTIIYNLEPQTSPQFNDLRAKLHGGHVIWDYSMQNVCHWLIEHRSVVHVPVGYAPTLTTIDRAPEADRDIDVLFFGWPNERRQWVLGELRKKKLKVMHVDNVYGVDRDQLMARSKVVLNMHYYMPPTFEITRVSLAWANRVAVVCEDSGDLKDTDRMSMVVVPYEKLADACQGLVNLPGVREDIEEVAFNAFRKQDVRITLEQAIRQLSCL